MKKIGRTDTKFEISRSRNPCTQIFSPNGPKKVYFRSNRKFKYFCYLRELFCDRNPGDARVKVGSERKVASRRKRPTGVSPRSGFLHHYIARRGPPKLALLAANRVPKRSSAVRGQSGPRVQGSSSVRLQVAIMPTI